jgi:predicted nucleic acid-binding protein
VSARRVVVDANIVFSALVVGRLELVLQFRPSDVVFHAPKFLSVELFKHRHRIQQAARVADEEVVGAYYAIMMRIRFYDESQNPIGTWVEAHRLCGSTDVNDMPYVTLALHLDAELWTEEAVLKAGLRARGFDRFFEP